MSAVSEDSTQTDLTVDIALHVLRFRECLGPLHEARADSHPFCRRSVVVDDELYLHVELQEEVSSLYGIHGDEQERGREDILRDTTAS